MPTKAVIDLIQSGHNTASKLVPFIPFNIHKRNCNSKKRWLISISTSLVITFTEIHYTLYTSKQTNLITLFYQMFIILLKLGAFICGYIYHTKQEELLFLLK